MGLELSVTVKVKDLAIVPSDIWLTFLKDINAITTTKFLSDEHFNDVVSSAIAKVDEMGYSEDKASDIVFTIQKFAAEQEWGDIIEIDGDDRPMASIVHNYYGSIDFAIHDAYWSFSNWSRSILEIIRKSISDNDLPRTIGIATFFAL
jgi:hypothetical protein